MKKQTIVLLIIVGVILFIAMMTSFSHNWAQLWQIIRFILRYSFAIYIAGLVFLIFIDHHPPQVTMAWLMIFLVSSYVGFAAYILFGRNLLKQRNAQRKRLVSDESVEYLHHGCDESLLDLEHDEDILKVKRLLLKSSKACLTQDNQIEIFSDGTEKFERLFDDLTKAKRHIHIEYFILKSDYVGGILKQILAEKAKAGLEIRLIYDAVGSWRLSKKYIQELKDAGVEVEAFYPVVLPVLSRELNYRNHRKIVVIDGEIGYVGGVNVGDEYIGLDKKFGYWRDSHLRCTGSGVHALQKVFLNDWYYLTKNLVSDDQYFPSPIEAGYEQMQVVESGPDYNWEAIKQAFFTIITGATKSLWITTPYLVPDEGMMMALRNAALSGVDVRIILPQKADHFMVYWATRDNLEQLLQDGVRIFLYRKGFIHSKCILVDQKVASIGTANLDNRSMGINYEVNAFVYTNPTIARLESDFLQDLRHCQELSLMQYAERPVWQKFLESVGRLFSPLQ